MARWTVSVGMELNVDSDDSEDAKELAVLLLGELLESGDVLAAATVIDGPLEGSWAE